MNGNCKVTAIDKERKNIFYMNKEVEILLPKKSYIIESVDERGFPLTQYIRNGGISHSRYIIMHFKHHRRVLRLLSNGMSI